MECGNVGCLGGFAVVLRNFGARHVGCTKRPNKCESEFFGVSDIKGELC